VATAPTATSKDKPISLMTTMGENPLAPVHAVGRRACDDFR
jgi:hypothetical protein